MRVGRREQRQTLTEVPADREAAGYRQEDEKSLSEDMKECRE